jgi:hypothetical protein
LFVKLGKKACNWNHHNAEGFKISSYDVQRNQIVLGMLQFNVVDDLKNVKLIQDFLH